MYEYLCVQSAIMYSFHHRFRRALAIKVGRESSVHLPRPSPIMICDLSRTKTLMSFYKSIEYLHLFTEYKPECRDNLPDDSKQ